jgi:hypothetical protein
MASSRKCGSPASAEGVRAPLTAPRLEALAPNWSPDGSHITFTSNSDRPQSSIYVMRANGTGVTRLATTKWPTNNFGSAYSPGGGQIAFSSDRRHPDLCCEELFVMRADGSRQHLVDTGIQGVLDVAWGSASLVNRGSPGAVSRPPAGRAGSRRRSPCPLPSCTRMSVTCGFVVGCAKRIRMRITPTGWLR